MSKWWVVVPNIEGNYNHDSLDCDYNFPRIKEGCFVNANSAADAIKSACKQLKDYKSSWAAIEFKPAAILQFQKPEPIFKEVTESGEVLPF